MAAFGWDRWGRPSRRPLRLAHAGAALALLASPASAFPIVGTWQGGPGDWTDGSLWDFDTPPTSASFPSNDASDTFTARIDGGKTGIDSAVWLAGSARIDRLEIDSGDSLSVGTGAALTLVRDATLAGSGGIANDGTLALSGAGSQLRFDGDLALSGTGLLSLADGAGARVASEDPLDWSSTELINGAGHRIEGAGTLESLWEVRNHGTIAATGDSALNVYALTLVNSVDGLLEARGIGGLTLVGLSNFGTVRVHSGSRLVSMLNGIINGATGVIRVEGAGTELSTDMSITNLGNLEVNNGARLSTPSLSHGFAATALTRIASGGEIAFTNVAQVGGGVLELDGGTLSSASDLHLDGPATELRGNGRIVLSGHTLDVSRNVLVSPGLGGAGLLEVDGWVELSGRLLAELGGTLPGAYDRLIAGRVDLGGSIEVSLLDGYLPARGDRFDLITGVSTTFIPRDLLSLPMLGDNLSLEPEIAQDGERRILRLSVLESLLATWTGGTGDYTDPSGWSFGGAPAEAVFPSNDASNLFRVRIDAAPGADAIVSLAEDVTIDQLEIGPAASLSVADGHLLDLVHAPNRPGSGSIRNDGTLYLDGAGGGASLRILDANLGLSGEGTVVLSDSPRNRIAASSGLATGNLVNEATHRIEGAGTVSASSDLINDGTIAATGTNPLTLSAARGIENTGLVEARGAGGLVLSGELTNTGSVRVLPGSRVASNDDLDNIGAFRVEGAGSQVSFSIVENRGLIEVLDGARLTALWLTQSTGAAAIRITGDGELMLTALSPRSFTGGVIELDAGTISSAANLGFGGANTTLRGDGRIALGGRTLSVANGALLSPGFDGAGAMKAGRIDLDGDLDITLGGRFEIDLGGVLDGRFDVMSVAGDVELGGLVTVNLIGPGAPGGGDPFLPALGDFFDVIVADSIVDFGATWSLPELGSDLAFLTSIVQIGENEALRLAIVPEPGTGALLALGLLVLAARCRR